MKLARINVLVSPDEKQVLFDYQLEHDIKTLDESLGSLLSDYRDLIK